ncbi:transient receptor potential cation channel subfamily V member 1 [Austrofundulus limnaeus]|uniref:Transient receptor potential cation channel subfamily V member 1 n=1 Tax=Austrofundulus limnaeus TaxID=52670 RepID=A0A2I4C515_AUSLI|nr:PREDICTED: transient receptor potential cation channel subfamily V member 1 [Austrofundulus limnaeus]XP_013875087.1 PREDICTED: transient receptor potential cation channel subfamily V member 1 [Austrofundulus limnaeus]
MDKCEMFGGFELEADDRTEEERSRQRGTKGDGLAPKAPMDTDYQEEIEEPKCKIRFNLGFDKGIRGEQPAEHRDDSAFTIERLFEAAASRDVQKLDGLYDYLHRNMKKLSDSLYQSYGKTALMKALLHLRDGKNETVDVLIDISERLGDIQKFVNAAFTNSYYKGQTALHIAIERRSLSYVKLLISKGADVHARACGKFFQPHDGPYFYFGELPLSLAACTNQPDIVEYLMVNEYQQADPKLVDSQGNTVLHALVMVAVDKTKKSKENTAFIAAIYDQILKITNRLHPKLKLEDVENHKGLTPLKLAARTGKTELFSYILKREFQENHTKHLSRKFTEWVYGPVHCSLYDLASVDSYEDNSVLEILIYGSDIPNRHKMLETELLSRLLEDKWKRFAGRMFLLNFLLYLLYLIVFTLVSYNKKNRVPPFVIENTIEDCLYVSGQMLTTLANLYFFFIGFVDMKRKRPKMKTLLVDGYYEILFFVQGFLFLVSVGLYLSGRQEYLGFLVVCLALSWVNMLYYSRGYEHMGIYSVMIQKMILSDILRFIFVYIVFLFGFSAAVVTLLIEPPVVKNTTGKSRTLFTTTAPNEDCVKPTFRNISYTILELFKFTIGMGDMEFAQDYQYGEVFYVLLIGYIILTYILLLNMLIALMNRTVENITKESASIWKLQRAVTILDMEKRLPCCLKKGLRCGVKKNLNTALGTDSRWCFRVEEKNWDKWNTNLSKINEDPGCCDGIPQSDSETSPRRKNRGRSLRGLFKDSNRWRNTSESTEMRHLY